MSTEQPCDFAYEFGDGMLNLPEYPKPEERVKLAVNVMDGKRRKLDSKGSETRCNEGVDVISQLPDDIIMSIRALLPLKEAKATSTLSSRWSDLWRRNTPNLDLCGRRKWRLRINQKLSSRDDLRSKYIEWVNSVLESHRCHYLKLFKISYPLQNSAHCTVTKWLEFAFSKRVEVLVLDFNGEPSMHQRQTNSVVLGDVLGESSILISTSLTRLYLSSLSVSGEAIKMFLRNCPLLKTLMIANSFLTPDLEVCGTGRLKKLIIKDCSGGKSIKLYAPNLTLLKIDSHSRHSRHRLCCIKASKQSELLRSFPFPKLTTFKLSLHRPKDFLKRRFPQMPRLRVLNVKYYGLDIDIRTINSLLCALPCLEQLKIKYIFESTEFENDDVEDVNFERFHHPHLRVFKLKGYMLKHMKLMSYILDNCAALLTIFIRVHKPSYGRFKHFSTDGEAAREKAERLLRSKLPTHVRLMMW